MAIDGRDAPKNGTPITNGGKGRKQCTERAVHLHRVKTVRRQQGVSLRTAARQLGFNIRDVRRQEDEANDLRLSELYNWQAALGVPLLDLLVDPGTSLSRPVLERARMVRLMKTALTIQQRPATPQVRRLTQMLVEQLIEIMPELAEVSPWHSVGQRRTLDEFGRISEHRLPDDFFQSPSVESLD
jgi:hypothetical protein